ncbi:VC0807 family protein [Coraliomargarita parva]|uniref:VC0807 family protein n=1 Tax=Coraliomargarita parva TaxID=3014050 RepID=UPI0022B583A8|nr:VC0807 family protein [Coraliomargarita parva]
MPDPQPSNRPETENPFTSHRPEVKKENTLLNIGFNIILPILILNKGKKWFGHLLEPHFDNVAIPILLIALCFPVGYFVYDYFRRKKYNIFSILGLISVLMTGGIGIFNIPTEWFAVKEAAIPALLGLAVIISLKTPYPLVRTLLWNPEIMDVDKVHLALRAHNAEQAFDKLLEKCTWLLAASFLLSAVLNYLLARWIVVSPSGSDAFNAEVSKMMAWSWPVIVIPSMVIMMFTLWLLLSGIHKMTGLKLEEVMHGAKEDK